MIEISKELLSEVLNYNVDKYTIVSSIEITQIRIFKKDAEMWDYRSYDIHHLAHKCKEWALSKDYKLVSLSRECFLYDTQELYDVSEQLNQWSEWFEANTEVEAIIKACEWILKEIKK